MLAGENNASAVYIESKWGRYAADPSVVTGCYASEIERAGKLNADAKLEQEKISVLMDKIKQFEEKTGRRPRIMIAKMGQDGHDRGAKVVASGFADLGFDVDVGPLFQTPQEVARHAVESDVHIVGASSQAAGHRTLVPMLVDELKKIASPMPLVVAGGVIPKDDYELLRKAGADFIFGPGTPLVVSATQIVDRLLETRDW